MLGIKRRCAILFNDACKVYVDCVIIYSLESRVLVYFIDYSCECYLTRGQADIGFATRYTDRGVREFFVLIQSTSKAIKHAFARLGSAFSQERLCLFGIEKKYVDGHQW